MGWLFSLILLFNFCKVKIILFPRRKILTGWFIRCDVYFYITRRRVIIE